MPDSFVPQPRFVRALLAVCLVIVGLVAHPLLSVATDQVDVSPDAALIEESGNLPVDTDGDGVSDDVEIANGTDPLTPPVPTPTTPPVEPTPMPAPPTQAPTAVPPIPTDVPPPPTQVPTAVPPTPTQVPTAVPPTPTPTPVSPTPTPVSPTPTPTPGGVSVQRIVSGSGCTQVSSTDIVPVGTAVEFRCNAADGPGSTTVTRTFSGLTAGWEYQVNSEIWRSTVGPAFSQYDVIPAFTLRLRPTAAVTPGSQGVVTVALSTNNGSGAYTTTVGATRQAAVQPTAADLQLTCDPVSVSAQVNAAQIVTCTYSGRASLNTRQVTLTRITVPVPAGWSITSPVGSVSGATLTITPNATITYSASSPQSYTFEYTIAPACTASTTSQPITMTSTFSYGSTTGIVGATFSQGAARANTSSLTVSVIANSLAWNESFSLTDTPVSGHLTYRVSAIGCSGWNVQVAASPYRYSGPNNGAAIPASNLLLTATGSPIVVSGSGTGVSRQAAGGPVNTPIKVLSATPGSGIGTYDQQLDFTLTIPGRALAGTYQSTITVTSAAAP